MDYLSRVENEKEELLINNLLYRMENALHRTARVIEYMPRLIMPAKHKSNMLGCRMLASFDYMVDGKHTWIPLEPISIESSEALRIKY